MKAPSSGTSATGTFGSGAMPEPQNARPCRLLQAPDARAVRPSRPDTYQRMNAPSSASGTSRPHAARAACGCGAIEPITPATRVAGAVRTGDQVVADGSCRLRIVVREVAIDVRLQKYAHARAREGFHYWPASSDSASELRSRARAR